MSLLARYGITPKQVEGYKRLKQLEAEEAQAKQTYESTQEAQATDQNLQFSKGLYNSDIFGGRLYRGMANTYANVANKINPAHPSGQQMQDMFEQGSGAIPEAKGFKAKFAKGVGTAGPGLMAAGPLFGAVGGASMLSGVTPIARTAIAGGIYGGGSAAGHRIFKGEAPQAGEVLGGTASGAGGAALFHGAGRLGVTAMPKWAGKVGERIGAGLGGYGAGKLLSPEDEEMGVFYGVLGAAHPPTRITKAEIKANIKGTVKGLAHWVPPKQRIKLARELNQSVLGFRKGSVALKHGDPALTLAKEGIASKSLDGLQVKVQERIAKYKTEVADILKTASTPGVSTPEASKSVTLKSYNRVLKPLQDYMKLLKRSPTTNSSEITAVENLMLDISGFKMVERVNPSTGKKVKVKVPVGRKSYKDSTRGLDAQRLENADVQNAYKIKQQIQQLLKNSYDSAGKGTDKTRKLKSVDWRMKKLITENVGKSKTLSKEQAKDLDLRLQAESDLISVSNQIEVKMNAEKANIFMQNLGKVKLITGALVGGTTGSPHVGVGTVVTMSAVEQALLKPGVKTAVASWLMDAPINTTAQGFAKNPSVVPLLKKTFAGSKKVLRKIDAAARKAVIKYTAEDLRLIKNIRDAKGDQARIQATKEYRDHLLKKSSIGLSTKGEGNSLEQAATGAKSLKYVNKAQEKMQSLQEQYNSLSEFNKISPQGRKLGDKLNKSIRDYKKIKGQYFHGGGTQGGGAETGSRGFRR